jgi:hypothetical protein
MDPLKTAEGTGGAPTCFIPNCTANTKAYSNDKNYNVQIVHIWYNKGALGKQRRVTKQRFRELNAIIALEGC